MGRDEAGTEPGRMRVVPMIAALIAFLVTVGAFAILFGAAWAVASTFEIREEDRDRDRERIASALGDPLTFEHHDPCLPDVTPIAPELVVVPQGHVIQFDTDSFEILQHSQQCLETCAEHELDLEESCVALVMVEGLRLPDRRFQIQGLYRETPSGTGYERV